MGPTRWRQSPRVVVGSAVLAFVAAVVVAATFFTLGGHGSGGGHAAIPPPHAPMLRPGMVPASDSA